MKKRLLPPLLALAALLSACGETQAQRESSQQSTLFAMDTVMTFTVYGSKAQKGIDAVTAEVDRLEALLSVTREDSQVWELDHAGGEPVTVGDDVVALLTAARELGDATGGALDVTMYPVVRLWGFTTGEYRVPGEEEIAGTLARTGYEKISLAGSTVTLPADMELDFGALAKGYAGERCRQLLLDAGVKSAILSLGGNVQTVGTKPDGSAWRVGIQNPDGGSGYVGVVELVDQAAVTSGGYQRYFEEDGVRYWHIMDPATGAPARSGLTSVTVIGDSGTACDALSTALFVMGRDGALDYWREHRDFEAILMDEHKDLWVTAGLAYAFTPTENTGYTLHIVEE